MVGLWKPVEISLRSQGANRGGGEVDAWQRVASFPEEERFENEATGKGATSSRTA